MSDNDSITVHDSFTEAAGSPGAVLDVGGCLIYLQEFVSSCVQVAYENFESRLFSNIKNKGFPINSQHLSKITDKQGIPLKLLRPSKSWIGGRIRVRILIEFEPDPPLGKVSGSLDSPLDDLRNE
ncbi:MAG: KGK domain-containing protein [Cyanobacteriota bacterium]